MLKEAVNAWNRFCCRMAKAWLDKLIIEEPVNQKLQMQTKTAQAHLDELSRVSQKE